MRTFLQRTGRYAPYASYGLTAGAVAGAPGSEYYSPVLDAVGNAFDLPGSSVRDLLVGRNPLDQFASPFSADNRVTGRDVLDHWGVTAPNKETGMAGWLDDPMEGLRDLAGFGVEILTDPLNVVSALKLSKLFRAGKKATTHNAALEALQRNPERQRLGREMVEAYGESGEHTMTLLDAATVAQKKDPNLVYGGVTAKRLEGAVAGIAATSAVADQLMESPLQQPAIPRPRLMQEEANDLFAGRIDQDQYNRLMDESGRAPVPRSEDHLTTLRDRMPPGFSNSPERIAAKGLDDLSPVVGMPVGARLDINEYARNNPVVTLHGRDGLNYARAVQLLPDETGKVSFGLVGGNKTNVKSPLEEYQFSAGPRGPAAVAAGEASKNSWAVVAGRVGALTSPDQVLSEIQAKMRDPQWQQVGYNPERHSYFYLSDDHRSRVVDADEVLQFGDFVLAKNPRTEMMSSEGVRDRLAAAGVGPEDADPRMLYQSPLDDQAPRGAIQFSPDGTTLMAFDPDPSTAPHEMSHYMRRRFMPGNPWTRDREEAFAGGFENFAATTSTSSPAMSAAFQYFNQEIPRVYDPQMGYRNLPARGGYDYADLLGVTETTSPLDPKQAPDLVTPAGMALVRNLLSRFSQHGGI